MARYVPEAFVGNLQELAPYVERELWRIAQELDLVSGGGTLYRATDTPALPTVAPGVGWEKLVDFDAAAPQRGATAVVLSVPESEIGLRRPQTWGASFVVSAVGLTNQREYEVRVFLNGNPTPLAAILDPSNQTTQATFSAVGVFRNFGPPHQPDVIDLRIRTRDGIDGTWSTLNAYFAVWSVGG